MLLEKLPIFSGCSENLLFNSYFPLNNVSEGTFGILPFTVDHLCFLRNAMLLHWSPGASWFFHHPLLSILTLIPAFPSPVLFFIINCSFPG